MSSPFNVEQQIRALMGVPNTINVGDLVPAGGTAGTGVTVAEYNHGKLRQTRLTLTNVSVTMTDATTAGAHGSSVLFTFPEGLILTLGAIGALTTAAGSGGIADNAALVGALGSTATATDNATLTTTEANIVPSTAGTLSSGAGTLSLKSTAVAFIDGTSSAGVCRLNLAVPDAGVTDGQNDTVTVNGTIDIWWIKRGDVA